MSVPHDDTGRLRAIAALDPAGAAPDAAFQALAALAATLLDCPVGTITLIDRDTPWVAAAGGAFVRAARRDPFGDRAILLDEPLLVPDAAADPRFAGDPAVTAGNGVRAYAGIAISARDPQTDTAVPVGTLSVTDTAARAFAPHHRAALARLRRLAEALIEARGLRVRAERQAEELRRHRRALQQAERMAEIGSWRLTLEDERVTWSDGVFRIYELDPGGTPPLAGALDHFPPHARAIAASTLATTIETGAPFDYETDFITARGRHRRVRSMGEIELRDGRPHAVVGVFQDVTERHAVEEDLRRSATTDPVTRIANRAAFAAELDRSVAAARAEGTALALILVDLDRFKAVNDTHGHLVGDDVLRAAGRRLRRAVRDGGFAARLGGDEFGLILTGAAAADVEGVARRLLAELARPMLTTAGAVPMSGTIGHAGLTADVDSVRALIHRADTALYHAKRTARGTLAGWGRMRPADRRSAAAA